MSGRAAPTAGSRSSPWTGGAWTWLRTPDRRLLALAVIVQVALVLLSVRASYDLRIFGATGYLVGTGHSPYVALNLRPVFHAFLYADLPAIGYPPPWPLLLGGIYRVTYALVPNLALYNAAIKLPVIAADVGLAYLAGAALQNLGAAPSVVRRAWIALLFNPFLLFVGAAWGQIDAIVALFALAAMLLVAAERRDLSAVVLALAVCVKPTAAPLLLAVLLFLGAGSVRRALRYAAVFLAGAFVFYVLPFLVFAWDTSPAHAANAQFSMAGAMSLSTVVQVWRGPLFLEGHWWLLGMLWAPALLVAVAAVRWRPRDVGDLLALSAGLALVFFLCRAWLSESNVVLVLAPVLILAALGRVDRRLFTALWVIAFAFTVANASPVQLLWVAFPAATEQTLAFVRSHSEVTLAVRTLLVVAWQIAGWWTVVACLRRPRASAARSGAGAAAEAAGPRSPAGTAGSAEPTREALS
jgi:dolichyl-phosphate-mannose-protein mannosyltransferase